MDHPIVCTEGESNDNEVRVTVYFDDHRVTYTVTPEGIVCDLIREDEVIDSEWNQHPTTEA